MVALCVAGFVNQATASPVTLASPSTSGTYNLSAGATWSGSQVPTNGNDVFIVFTANANGANKNFGYFTNAPSNVFVADSLSVTNSVGGNQSGTLTVSFSGTAFFTSGVAQVNFGGGPTANADTTKLTFSSNVTFGAMNFIGNSASGNDATLTLAGTSRGNSLLFNGGGAGNNFLVISGPLGLTGTLTATNINNTSAGTISGNSTVARVIFNNDANNKFTITNSTMSITGAVSSVAGGFTLANNATLALTGAGGLIISNVAPVLNGTVQVNSSLLDAKVVWNNNGTLTLAGGYVTGSTLTNANSASGYGTFSNAIVNTPGTALLTATNGELTLVGSVSGLGKFRAVSGGVGGTLTFAGGGSITALENSGANIKISGAAILTNVNPFANAGTMIFAGGNYFSSANVSNLSSSLITGQGTLNAPLINAGTVEATNGTLVVAQNPTLSGGTINVRQGGTLQFGAGPLLTVTNLVGGMVNLYGGSLVQAGLVNNGQIVNQSGSGLISNGLVNASGAFLKITSGNLKIVPELQNFGVVSNSAALTVGSTGTALFRNDGKLVLNVGTVYAGTITNGSTGFIQGNGILDAALVYSTGTIAPGLGGVGAQTYGGNLTLAAGGTNVMEVTGLGVNDQITATNVTWGGTLKIDVTGGVYVPTNTWTLFSFGSQSGDFGSVLLTTNGFNVALTHVGDEWYQNDPGTHWVFNEVTGQLQVIPEPSALTLVGIGLVLTVLVNRRRSRA